MCRANPEEMTEKSSAVMTASVSYDKSVANTIVADVDTFFEDLINGGSNCVDAMVSCALLDASGKAFSYSGL